MIIELRDLPNQSDSSTIDEQIYFTDGETGSAWNFTDFDATIVVREMLSSAEFGEICFQGNEDDGQLSWPAGKSGGYLQILFSPNEIDVPKTARYAYIITFTDDVSGEVIEAITYSNIRKVVP